MLAGEAIEFPGMPRANKHVAMESAVPQRTATVRTDAVHCVQNTFHIANGIRLSTDNDLTDFAGWKRRHFSNLED